MSKLSTTIGAVLQGKSREMWSTTPDTSVYKAIEMMAEKQVGSLLVMEQDDVVGVLSERDYARKVILQGRSSNETTVSEIMSPPISVSPEHTVADCMVIMTNNRVRHLPVKQAGKVVGIVSIGDLVNAVISAQDEAIRHLESYICGTPR
ncbi:CBS domain-containing protein [Edaphobacter bradus]|uniref:CBS domain-containing protein n=1 Tax=Edaphobacter bradus TaxID=2259016 RepID=UPI0021E00C29|nr:CBS domain-containing protein [Edaphobacter bradus]